MEPVTSTPHSRDLAFTPEVERATRDAWTRLRHVIPEVEWPVHAPFIAAINRLKKERNAVILAHNYQTPEIFHGVADIKGDSLALAREAQRTPAEVIVLCGVHFMAETAKILNPEKTVLIPDLEAGCSLAASITAADVRALRARHPGVPVVTYVNTSAAVKAETDICCTSANAVAIVESLPGDRVIFLPDEYLASWVAGQTTKEVIPWQGHCEVHERFTGPEIREYRKQHPGLVVLAHPECPPDVLAEADFVGSTAKMSQWVGDRKPAPRGDGHRVLDERQRRGRSPRARVRAALQPLPAHEADHAAQDPALARDHDPSHRDRPRRRRARGALGRADARDERHRAGRHRGRRADAERRTDHSVGRRQLRRDMETRSADVIVLGAGVAGLRAVLALEPLRVALVTKTMLGVGGSSPYAQGGIAAALDRDDSPAPARRRHPRGRRRAQRSRHRAAADRARAGRDRAPGRRRDALRPRRPTARSRSAARPRTAPPHPPRRRRRHRRRDGALAVGGGGAASAASRSASGASPRSWWSRAAASPASSSIRGGGRPRLRIEAPAVILATGGAGQLYRYTTNPPELTGDGLAMAARAGASLVDLEFVQFHPTALAAGHDPLPLLTEALRGEGAVVIDETGARFLLDVHRDAELAPRDVVARAIFEHQRAGHRVFLDARAALGERIAQRFPTVYKSCRAAGIDPAVEPIPVTPAAHYFMGGVMVDAQRPHHAAGPVGLRRGVRHRRARRQPAGVQLAARSRGVRQRGGGRRPDGDRRRAGAGRGGRRSRARSRCASPAPGATTLRPSRGAGCASRCGTGSASCATPPASSARSTTSTPSSASSATARASCATCSRPAA